MPAAPGGGSPSGPEGGSWESLPRKEITAPPFFAFLHGARGPVPVPSETSDRLSGNRYESVQPDTEVYTPSPPQPPSPDDVRGFWSCAKLARCEAPGRGVRTGMPNR